MKRFKTREYEKDCRIAGKFNGATLAIARAVTKDILPDENAHLHSKVTEYYIFLKGKAEMQINDEIVVVSEGDVIVVELGETHKLTKIFEELDYITVRDSVEDDKVISDSFSQEQ